MTDGMLSCWWMRHAPIHHGGKTIGHTDLPAILPRDKRSAALPLPDDAVWFASPLQRATQTAQWLMTARLINTAQLRISPELSEQHFGTWEGKTPEETHSNDLDWSAPENIRPEGGESFVDVCLRLDDWLETLLSTHTGTANAVIVTHAGPIRAALRHALGIAPRNALAFALEYGSLTRITYFRGERLTARVESVNVPGLK